MSRSDEHPKQRGGGAGGEFSVDGQAVEIDLAEWGWPGDRAGDAAADDGAPADDRPRLQKALAHAGVASRRACEALITGAA